MPTFSWRLLLTTIARVVSIFAPGLYCPRFDVPVSISTENGPLENGEPQCGHLPNVLSTQSESWPLNHFTPFIDWTWEKKWVQCLKFHSPWPFFAYLGDVWFLAIASRFWPQSVCRAHMGKPCDEKCSYAKPAPRFFLNRVSPSHMPRRE